MFKVFAGPCVIESSESVFEIAEELKKITKRFNEIDFYFKASFDKANRSSIHSYRGPGMEKGLKILKSVKEKLGVKIITDIHEPYQAEHVSKVADIIQIPAFLCRQTDLLIAAAKTLKPINVKKGQFLSPYEMLNIIEKITVSGGKEIFLCERGTSFGYNQLVVDMTSIVELKKFGNKVIFDATHSVQKPGANVTSSGGNREYIPYLAKAATAVGIDGLFVETHQSPDNALSDGPNSLSLSSFENLLSEIMQINSIIKEGK